MERLTSRQMIKHSDGTERLETYCHGHRYGLAAFPNKYGTSEPQEYKNYLEMIDRLAAYEDAEEQGRLVVLPCKTGRTIYVIDSKKINHCITENVLVRNGLLARKIER